MRKIPVALRIRKEELPSYLSSGWLHVRDLPAPPSKPSRQPLECVVEREVILCAPSAPG